MKLILKTYFLSVLGLLYNCYEYYTKKVLYFWLYSSLRKKGLAFYVFIESKTHQIITVFKFFMFFSFNKMFILKILLF
jgi:hypothetical protein